MSGAWSEGTVRRHVTSGPALYQISRQPDAPRAVVGILHGYADHAARYTHIMEAWAGMKIASIALDLRGHGRATGPRGHCSRFEDYLDDVAELAHLLDEQVPRRPTFLYGHSFGGLVAVHSVMRAPGRWDGLLLGSPYLGLALKVPAPNRWAAGIASRVAPSFSLPTGLTGAHVTHDPVKARGYDADPLVFKRATARWFTETLIAQQRALALAPVLSLPLRLVVGSADPVARVSASRAFFEAAGPADKTWDERPGLYHEVLNEPEWAPIASDMAGWMLDRLGQGRW